MDMDQELAGLQTSLKKLRTSPAQGDKEEQMSDTAALMKQSLPNQLGVQQALMAFQSRIDYGIGMAKVLKKIVEQCGLAHRYGSTEHLDFEGWSIIGTGFNVTCATRIAEMLKDIDGISTGVKAHADLLDPNGVIVGGADSICMFDEPGHKGQLLSQISGMAQTRAASRAYRESFSWVAALAGYKPTPAEEMAGVASPEQAEKELEPERSSGPFCQTHKVSYRLYAKGDQSWYAHKLPDGKWCNMPQKALEKPQREQDPLL